MFFLYHIIIRIVLFLLLYESVRKMSKKLAALRTVVKQPVARVSTC